MRGNEKGTGFNYFLALSPDSHRYRHNTWYREGYITPLLDDMSESGDCSRVGIKEAADGACNADSGPSEISPCITRLGRKDW